MWNLYSILYDFEEWGKLNDLAGLPNKVKMRAKIAAARGGAVGAPPSQADLPPAAPPLLPRELRGWAVQWAEVQVRRRLGRGNFGEVHLAVCRGHDMACKHIAAGSDDEHAQAAAMLLKEIKALAEMHHANVIRLMGVCIERHHLCALIEYAARGTVRDVLERHPDLPLWRRFQLLYGAVLGCAALHAHKPRPILHHDIKTVNLLVSQYWVCKLADFGLATGLGTLPTATKGGGGGGGTIHYQAPEVMNDDPFTHAADTYALGVVVYEVLTGLRPWTGFNMARVMMAVQRGERPQIPDGCDPFLADVAARCWAADTDARPPSSALAEEFARVCEEPRYLPPDAPAAQPWMAAKQLLAEELVWEDREGFQAARLPPRRHAQSRQRSLTATWGVFPWRCLWGTCARVSVSLCGLWHAPCVAPKGPYAQMMPFSAQGLPRCRTRNTTLLTP